MNSSPRHDPLIDLWLTAPPGDSQSLLHALQRQRRMNQRLRRSVLAILCAVSVLLLTAEATGRVATHGVLSVIWIAALATGAFWQRRAACRRIDACALDTISLLKSMLARARSELFIARCLYAGVPCGAVAGAFAMSGFPVAADVHPELHHILTGAGIAVLLVMVAGGLTLARSRRLEVKVLKEKLNSVEAGL